MISGEYLPTLPSFSIAFRASGKETFLKRKSSTTIFGVIMKGTFRNLAALNVIECRFSVNKEEPEIEIIVDGENAFFSWNNEAIQKLAGELGETDFPEPRPCG